MPLLLRALIAVDAAFTVADALRGARAAAVADLRATVARLSRRGLESWRSGASEALRADVAAARVLDAIADRL